MALGTGSREYRHLLVVTMSIFPTLYSRALERYTRVWHASFIEMSVPVPKLRFRLSTPPPLG